MLKLLSLRRKQGSQYIPDLRKPELNERFRGLPELCPGKCKDCSECARNCPTGAITSKPLKLDMGKCVFCGECERNCPNGALHFSNFHKIASSNRARLVVDAATNRNSFEEHAVQSRAEIRKLFGRSFKLRSVSAGGCNGCEMELNACGNVNFDMGRFGIDIVASPRHADGIIITGPVSENMAYALEDTFRAIPDPKVVIAAGACAISGGIFQESPAINRQFFAKHQVDLYIPGCPIHPLTVINGILDFLSHK